MPQLRHTERLVCKDYVNLTKPVKNMELFATEVMPALREEFKDIQERWARAAEDRLSAGLLEGGPKKLVVCATTFTGKGGSKDES